MLRFTGISFKPDFKARSQAEFQQAQKYVDSETIRYSDPYVPFRTGIMKKSGISGTVVGSGVVEYTAPYARGQYYTNAGRGKEGLNAAKGTKGLRGPFFLERMKADHLPDIRRGLKEKFD
jgi:hypothetical protein